MADLVVFLKICAASRTLVGSLCALLVVPFLAWVALRCVAPFIRNMTDDAPWQAPLASLAATLPGVIFLTLAVVGAAGAQSSGCLQFVWGRILFATTIALVIGAFSRAVILACRRTIEVRRLIALSNPAIGRVAEMALRVGVTVRVLSYAEPFCAIARVFHPVVLVSSATIDSLDSQELEAALRHEHAHAVRGDVAMAAAVSFFADLLPLPAGDLLAIYRVAREFAADQHAVRKSNPEHLAAAIVLLAGSRSVARESMAALAEDSATVKARVISLLEERAAKSGVSRRRAIAVAALSTIATIGLTPAVLSALNFYACTVKGMHF